MRDGADLHARVSLLIPESAFKAGLLFAEHEPGASDGRRRGLRLRGPCPSTATQEGGERESSVGGRTLQ